MNLHFKIKQEKIIFQSEILKIPFRFFSNDRSFYFSRAHIRHENARKKRTNKTWLFHLLNARWCFTIFFPDDCIVAKSHSDLLLCSRLKNSFLSAILMRSLHHSSPLLGFLCLIEGASKIGAQRAVAPNDTVKVRKCSHLDFSTQSQCHLFRKTVLEDNWILKEIIWFI